MTKERKPTFDPEYIRDISVSVYCQRLVDAGGAGAADRMVADDEDNGEKLRGRAASYDALTRTYLKVLGFTPQANEPAYRKSEERVRHA